MEILILTSVIITLFLVFLITIWRELSKVSSPNYKPEKGRPKGGRYAVFNFVEDMTKPKVKKNKPKIQFSTIADMETDGVYFDRENSQVISKEYVKKFKKRMKNK